MVTDKQRRFVKMMIWLKFWKPYFQMRLIDIHARIGTYWLKRYLLKKQAVDNLHHAPCCPANHYHKARFVFQPCTCGAANNINFIKSQAAG